jgi:ectoine hydroxylase-related dioxygenase (phytanoyl-CoA dioxygenase family)
MHKYEEFKKSTLNNYKDQLVEGEDIVEGKFRRMVNFHLIHKELQDIFALNDALEVTDYFFGEPTTLYTSLYFEVGSAQAFHRDTPYFWTNPGYRYFGVWCALEDVDENNGALKIIPGSHKIIDDDDFRNEIGLMDLDENKRPKANSSLLWDLYQSKVYEKCKSKGLQEITVRVNKGDTIIWHPQLMHGGVKLGDSKLSRNSFVMHVTPRNYNVYAQDKYFDTSAFCESKNPSVRYITASKGREFRHDGVWAIAQKIFINA